MKESFYNTFIEIDEEITLFYNSLSNTFLLINSKLNQMFLNNKNSYENLRNLDFRFFNLLLENGFIIEENTNEKEMILYERTKKRFSSSIYEVLINPTLDCNLNCWYCYETHKKDSVMSDKLIESIVKHLKLKYKTEPFSFLSLGFFGGEPLLKTDEVVVPLIKKVNTFAKSHNIKLTIAITTNGTIFKNSLFNILKNFHVSFQITIDGDKISHNLIRNYKTNKKGTYDTIIKNIKKIQNNLIDFGITLRINYDKNTLSKVYQLIDDLSFLDRSKVIFHLTKIWQEKVENINNEELYNTIELIRKKDFKVNDLLLEKKDYICYADNYSEIMVNYNAKIYKCSANDFTDENAEGILLENGEIKWYNNKLVIRLNSRIPEFCLECKLLPSCPGICTQSIVDGNATKCIIENRGISIEDVIINNFNYQTKE